MFLVSVCVSGLRQRMQWSFAPQMIAVVGYLSVISQWSAQSSADLVLLVLGNGGVM